MFNSAMAESKEPSTATSYDWQPLLPQQALVWASEHRSPGTLRFQRIFCIRSNGTLDPYRLQQAWARSLASHDILGFVIDDKEPRQRFVTVVPDVEEVSLPEGLGLERWIAEYARKIFDWSRPLWQLTLVTGPGGDLSFVLRAHHLVCDEASFAAIASEVSSRYLSLPVEEDCSFRTFLANHFFPEAVIEQGNGLTQQLLDPPPPVAMLPGCYEKCLPESTVSIRTSLSAAANKRLESYIERLPALNLSRPRILDLLVSSSVFAWIYRLTGQQDILISLQSDGRTSNGAPVVGPMDWQLFLRVRIDEGETFETLLSKTRQAWDSASTSSLSSAGIDSESAFLGVLPEWPSSFCGQPAEFRLSDAAALQEAAPGQAATPGKPIIRYSRSTRGFNGLCFDFPGGVFPEDVKNRLAGYFLRLLEAMLEDPTLGVRAPDLVTDAERILLLREGLGLSMPKVEDLLSVIARQVALRPDSPAVEFNSRPVSYADLDRFTNRLARRLHARGVVTGSRVAVAMPRGLGEFMSILAVLKAGGVFVPVDPAHPIDRVRMILEDAHPQLVILPPDTPLGDALPQGVPVLFVDDPLTESAEVDDTPLDLAVESRQTAYVIFTSGSTGRPKGVEIPRGGISNFLQSAAHKPGLGPGDRLAAISTTTFDMSELDFFLPLCVGGTVVIAERAQAMDPVLLRKLLEDRNITVMQATPTTWRMLLDAGWKGHESFKVFTGGEPVSLALANRLLDTCCELWNLYGPTETSVYSTIDRITGADERITVGRPIENTRITIRDPEGRLVPRFAIGELCIGGSGLALGYFNQPGLTADRFPTDPRSRERYYRTGDLGRYLPDGRLECLGRMDFQVKVRGFRIELTDIEAQLRSMPGVSDVLVMALRHGEGDPRLVAYWVGSAKKGDLHERAKNRLPYYMVPSAYVHLEAFPLTTSGKVDRKQLPPPGAAAVDDMERGTAPRNDHESIVAAIWRDVLELPFVPVDEDFFMLGGTSIRLTRMRTLLQKAFGTEIALKTLFDHPTVESLVPFLGESGVEEAPVVSLLAKGKDPIPWVGLMGIQLFQDLATSMADDYSTMAIHVPIRYIPGVDPFPTVQEIARRYVRVIREHQPDGPYFLLGLCHGGIVAFEAAAQLEEAGLEVALVVLLDADLPLARRSLPGARLSFTVRSFVKEPGPTFTRLASRVKSWFLSSGLESDGPDHAAAGSPVALASDEAGIDADLAQYQNCMRKVQCEVITFRATESDAVAPWIRVSPDMGWTGRAASVSSHDIPSSHLGIVRAPYVRDVARLMNEARKRFENQRGAMNEK